MASQEHLQQLMNDDNDDSSSSSSSSSDMEGNEEPAISGSVSTTPTPKIKLSTPIIPKPRMKISLKFSSDAVEEEEDDDDNDNDETQSGAKGTLPMAASFPKVPARPRSQSPRSQSPTFQRQRLNKRSLPIKKKKSPPPKKETHGGEIKATIVNNDDGGEDDAVATAVDDELSVTVKATPVTSNEKSPKKKSNAPNYRSFRLPPFSSPGLLVPITHPITMIKGKLADDPSNPASSGLTTMGSVFDQYLRILGYTEESRTKVPHVGSSIKRQVGDMFDNNINFTTQFPKLVPEDLIPSVSKDDMGDEDESRFSLAKRLIGALKVKPSSPDIASSEAKEESKGEDENSSEAPRKRQKLKSWNDMVPLSLTLPYPESYVQKQLEYADKVNKRESAILAYKKEVESLERENPELSEDGINDDQETMKKPTTVVPPIPTPPSPPHLSDLTELDKNQFMDSAHPIYLPKSKDLVAHLDKDCFHITEGRYFGLSSNKIADPNFVGPVAPGIANLNLTASNALATAQAGGLNMGNFPNPSTLPSAPANKSNSSVKKTSTVSQTVSTSPAIVKKRKKKPAISLPLRPMSIIKKTVGTAVS